MRVTFVHINDQVHFDPTTAALAGVFKERMWMDWHVYTDFSTTKDGFVAAVRSNEPLAVAFRVTKETREIVRFLAGLVGEQPEQVPVVFFGPLCHSHPDEVVGLSDAAIILTGEPEVGAENLLSSWKPGESIPNPPPPGCWFVFEGAVMKGAAGGPADLSKTPKPDLVVFGGDRVFRRGIGSSMFGELKVLPFLTGHGSPSGLPINANLWNFSYATFDPPRCLDVETMTFRLRALGPRVDHIEIWDREFGWDGKLAAEFLPVLHTRQRKKTYSLRVLAETFRPEILEMTDRIHSLRLVTEMDAATPEAHRRIPGSQNPDKVAIVVEAAKKAGMEPGILLTVGLPYETLSDIRKKIDFIRKSGVKRLRCVPFEPGYGLPIHRLCDKEGMLAGRGDQWNREVVQPLNQSSLPAEDWHIGWQECQNLQAELYVGNPARFEPANS